MYWTSYYRSHDIWWRYLLTEWCKHNQTSFYTSLVCSDRVKISQCTAHCGTEGKQWKWTVAAGVTFKVLFKLYNLFAAVVALTIRFSTNAVETTVCKYQKKPRKQSHRCWVKYKPLLNIIAMCFIALLHIPIVSVNEEQLLIFLSHFLSWNGTSCNYVTDD